jgi:phytanoyl-CoA hydroxylase
MDSRSREQYVAAFKEEGFLILKELLDPGDFQPLIAELDAVVDRLARQAHAEGRLRELYAEEPFERRLARIGEELADPDAFLAQIEGKGHKTAGLFAIMTHPNILDLVESLIGPEILAHPQFNLRAKLPGHAIAVVPWHQDLAYLEADADETPMVNFWVPLVDAPMEAGAIQVIPGSHRWGLVPHERVEFDYLGLPDSALPPHDVVPNLTDRVRWSLDIRYSDPARPTGRAAVPGFLARSQARPDALARSHRDWLALFE